ncbi:MAG TPA: glutamyl-tRNA reductase [Actinomycetales bacterium]|nr:glutamyl-tRNA reductase [Actinomycetales bacterium]
MSVLVIGVSHRSAPLSLLERVALDRQGVADVATALRSSENVAETVVVATCNRVELYAEVATFHAGLADLSAALSEVTGVPLEGLRDHLYVHYADRAVAHLFTVACGLDSMAVGESQVLGQLRGAWEAAQQSGSAGRVLGRLMQQAFRVGKRAHAETGIDHAGASLVSAALSRAENDLGPAASLSVLVVGAGSMSALAATTLRRAGVGSLTIVNRTPERAQRLADAVEGTAVPFEQLGEALAAADLVVSCTGAVGHVVDAELAARGAAARSSSQLYVDLALPRDVDPGAGDVPGVTLVDLEGLGRDLAEEDFSADVEQVRALVAEEVGGYLAQRRVQAVAPTVVALRARAAEFVEVELARLAQRLPDVDDAVREQVQREVASTVHRVVDKLLHTPTVRVKELAGRSDGGSYAAALRELFDLDLEDVTAVTEVPVDEAQPVPPSATPRAAPDASVPPADVRDVAAPGPAEVTP